MRKLWRDNQHDFALVKRSLYFYDEERFAQEICRRWVTDKKTGQVYETPDFHKEIWDEENKAGDVLFVVPRNFAKTTADTKIKTLHSMLFQYEPATLIISSEGLGEEVVGDIRFELETNYYIKLIWGNQVPHTDDKMDFSSRKWRQKHLQLLNGTEVETISKGGSLRGKRPSKIRIDDPQEDKDVKNPQIALEYWDWVWSTVYNMLAEGGSMSVLGTIISENCFANMLLQDAAARGFRVVKFPAILMEFEPGEDPEKVPLERYFEEGRSLWPERWPMSALKKRWAKIGTRPFLQEFMHKPMIRNGSPVFSEDHQYRVLKPIQVKNGIAYFKKLTTIETYMEGDEEKKRVVPIYDASIGIDFGFGRIDGDPHAIIMRNPAGELLAEYRGWMPQDVLCKIVDELRSKVKNVVIVPENNSCLAFLNAARDYNWHSEIYRKRRFDRITDQESEELGFNTNAATKTLIINSLDQRFRNPDGWEVSEVERQEITKYYYDEKGGMNAIAPNHDDTIIADAMCVQGLETGVTGPLLIML